MKTRELIALAGVAALAATLSFGCRNAGTTNPPATNQPVAERPAGSDHRAGDSAPERIVTDEPESYSATLRLTAETAGERAAALPHLEADVARRGRDRRISFRLPDGEQVVYLSRGGMRYVILPDRGRYAEVTSRAAGFELPRLLTPDGLVDYLKGRRGYVRAGEEEMNGRTVVKYVASGESRAGTRAGDMTAESVVYVDKLTGLPLRAELAAEAAGAGRGDGVKVVAEVRNVRTEVDPGVFAVPRRMEKVEADEVRRQVNSLVNAAARIAGSLLDEMSAAVADTSAGR